MALCNMMSPIRFVFWLFLSPLQSSSHSLEPLIATTLTASNPSADEAQVIIGSPSEVTESDSWTINVREMDTWHLKAQLRNIWGFHPTKTSAITITIDSPTTPGSTLDDILVAFTVPNSNQFTAVRIFMENTGSTFEPDILSRISPQCDTSSPPSQRLIDGDLDTILEGHYNRKCALGLSTWSCASTDNQSGMQPPGQSNSFPLTFTLLNIPNDSGYLIYEGAIVQSCGFANGFKSNNGLDVYLALGSYDDSAEISSFQITYNVDTTLSPNVTTFNPTTFPTTMPSTKPTLESRSISGESAVNSLSTTVDMVGDVDPMTDDSVSSWSFWSEWIDGPYFIPSAGAAGAVTYTLCMVMVCCCWRRKKKTNEKQNKRRESDPSIAAPHHLSMHSTMSNVSDARSIMSSYSNISVPRTHSLQSSGHFDIPPMLFATNSGASGMTLAPPLYEQANGHELVGHLGRINRGGDAYGILNNMNNMAPVPRAVPAMRLVNTVTCSTVETNGNSSNEDDDIDTGEDDHDEELYAKSRPHGQLMKLRGTTRGYEHLQLRHETAGALPVPIAYRNEAELPSTLHISATLPESLPLSPPESSAEPFMMLRECTQCHKETEEENGKVDENDGDWYCNDCWTFYE